MVSEVIHFSLCSTKLSFECLGLPVPGAPTDWQYFTTPQPNAGNRSVHWPRGKILGGCSAVNAMVSALHLYRTTIWLNPIKYWSRPSQLDVNTWNALIPNATNMTYNDFDNYLKLVSHFHCQSLNYEI